ncbi:MAG: hypothetical protein CL916_13250 [Deltaproteobacteria bacterium]|nr:hypothetical protein [Deltaproteobacteria bacterium]
MRLLFLMGLLGCDPIKERGVTASPHTTKSTAVTNTKINTQERTPVQVEEFGTEHDAMMKLLYNSQTAPSGIEQLVKVGNPVLSSVGKLLSTSEDLIAKGWAIQAVAKIKTIESKDLLMTIEKDTKQEKLVRTWAASALVQLCTTTDELISMMPLVQQYPALSRPVGMQLDRLSGGLNPLQALEMSLKIPNLKEALQENIISGDPRILIEAMLTHADMNIRRQSAAYLATMGRTNKATIPALIKAYDFTPKATQVMWNGGPLYVPSVSWDKENGTALFAHLVSWHLFCDKKGFTQEKQQLYNNMRSVTLLGAIGMPRYIKNDTGEILKAFKGVVGSRQIQIMLEEQGMKNKYANVLGGK